ncbi:hypothetical protein NKG94_37780 [Micromonospora sp. M12]
MTVDEELGRALTELTRTLTRSRTRTVGSGRGTGERGSDVSVAWAWRWWSPWAARPSRSPGRAGPRSRHQPTRPIPSRQWWSGRTSSSSRRRAVPWPGRPVCPPGLRRPVGGPASWGLPASVAAAQREFSPSPVPLTGVKVLFVDDIAGKRIALAALVREEPDRVTGWPSAAVWLVADEGASASELASTASIQRVSDALEPYESLAVDIASAPGTTIHLAIAPADCVFLSSPLPDGGTFRWTPEPTGSYLIRSPQDQRPEWWRVDCGEVTRVMTAGPGSLVSSRSPTASSRPRCPVPAASSRNRAPES